MKIVKIFFELFEKITICRINHCTHGGNKFFRFKANIFIFAIYTTILIPCLLQFPLIAFGQDGHDFVDSGLMNIKISGECIKSKSIIIDSGDTIRKGRLIRKNGATKNCLFVPPVGKKMADTLKDNSKNSTKEQGDNNSVEPSFFYRQFVDPFSHEPADSILFWAIVLFFYLNPVFSGGDDDNNFQ